MVYATLSLASQCLIPTLLGWAIWWGGGGSGRLYPLNPFHQKLMPLNITLCKYCRRNLFLLLISPWNNILLICWRQKIGIAKEIPVKRQLFSQKYVSVCKVLSVFYRIAQAQNDFFFSLQAYWVRCIGFRAFTFNTNQIPPRWLS